MYCLILTIVLFLQQECGINLLLNWIELKKVIVPKVLEAKSFLMKSIDIFVWFSLLDQPDLPSSAIIMQNILHTVLGAM